MSEPALLEQRTQRLKVLHVLPLLAPRAGGYVTFALQAAASLQEHGVDAIVYATDLAHLPMARSPERMSPADAPYGADRLDVRLGRASPPRRLANSWQMWRELPRLVRTVDLVHIHSLWLVPQLAGYLSCRWANVPYVVSPHGALDPYLRRRGRARKWLTDRVWQRRMLRGAAALHVTTEEERDLVADVAPAVPRFVVPVGVHLADYAELPAAAAFCTEHLDAHTGPVVLFLGRVTYKKGLDVLVRGFARTAPGHDNALLVIVGPDDEGLTPSLRGLADRLGVADRVRFVPALYGREKLAALAAASVWVLASHTENFGVSVLEAAAAGLPIIVSPQVNLAAALVAAGGAAMAEVEPSAVAAAITELLDDGARRTRLGAAARKFAAAYDWSTVSPALAAEYRRIVSRQSGRGMARTSRPEALRKACKLLHLLRTPTYRRALRHGVAATIEHEVVPFGHDFRTVIDVGAHQGQFSLFAATRFPHAMLWAVEPLAEPRARLERVLAGRPGVTVIPLAASRTRGTAAFHVSRASDSSSLLEITAANTQAFPGTDEARVIEVQTAPLDELVDGAALARPCLLKIDVQGGELDVLAGAERTLQSIDEALVECSFVELYRGQALAAAVVSHMSQRGFELAGTYSLSRDAGGRRLQADFLFRRRSLPELLPGTFPRGSSQLE